MRKTIRALWASTFTTHHLFLRGSHTAGITVFSYLFTCTCARNGACTWACTGGTASNRHVRQWLRHAAWCYPRRYSRSSSFVCGYKLPAESEQPCSFGRSLPEGHGSTGAHARISQTRISRQFGRCAPTRRRVQHKERLRHHQYAEAFPRGSKSRKSPTSSRRLWAFHKRRVGNRHLTGRSQAWKSTASTS